MDSLIAAAARALASCDWFGAPQLVALREDPSALALRSIATAQLGEHALTKALLRGVLLWPPRGAGLRPLRRLLLLGRLDAAAAALAPLALQPLPATLCAVTELAVAELALRAPDTAAALGRP